ncbi:unannotated protein [freshwater metagenome]|uniref:Unannotated protein n=1 Tax=freshwater metagenome TaxID=449393 RepID=A0A6J7AX92_9ZZZZ|nr:hypothetical protein [Actinomycetota bacterium]MSW22822.1 hypothetical protein [Actinomycetota bacterium]MSX04274.1 hypothetical protein [Actinomycetota bacterium]MSX61615.1 hypothetical protein [Actinomycetota bacterium]MSX84174.1 hypothetical protein [Actinomycetota bacterium]
MNKKIAVVVMATALSLGTIGTIATAQADSEREDGIQLKVATALSGLVTKGTITQAQSDAITAAIIAAAPVKHMAGGMGSMGKNSAAHQALIISTLGITAADLSAARLAGKSLATLAGDKKGALITALVNLETTEIDAAVTAGKLTAAQATTAKAGLTARVTKQVEAVPGPKIGGMGKGDHDRDGAGAAKPMSLKKKS